MNPRIFLAASVLAFFSEALLAQPPARDIPHLQKNGQATQLMVEGKPFLVLGGELHNSSSTSRAYMAKLWPKLTAGHVNTVLAAVPWDVVEPAEGKFDFTMVDQLTEDARSHGTRLVLLWFGSWKNGLSHYVPEWVKADSKRFPRALTRHGTLEILSTFSDANRDADAKAFAALMKHVREADEKEQTVIMVQVQNEVGLHADSRDRNAAANAAFSKAVPRELMDHLQKNKETLLPELRALWQAAGFKKSGTWEEVFGASEQAEEAFMAWSYARYVNRVTEAGKAEYALPMFVNAWIVQPQDEHPGDYPTGGPQAHVLDLWRAGAPKIDMFCPDIYLPKFTEVCAEYRRGGGAEGGLFVPESRAGAEGMANAFMGIGRFKCIGYSPFGIENQTEALPGYPILEQLAPMILEAQAKGIIAAVSLTKENTSEKITLAGYTMEVSLVTSYRATTPPERAYALVIAMGAHEFIVAGSGVQVTFATLAPGDETVGLAKVEEGVFEKGKWIPGRNLNGDEVMISYELAALAARRQTGTALKFQGANPTVQRVKLYRFPQAK